MIINEGNPGTNKRHMGRIQMLNISVVVMAGGVLRKAVVDVPDMWLK